MNPNRKIALHSCTHRQLLDARFWNHFSNACFHFNCFISNSNKIVDFYYVLFTQLHAVCIVSLTFVCSVFLRFAPIYRNKKRVFERIEQKAEPSWAVRPKRWKFDLVTLIVERIECSILIRIWAKPFLVVVVLIFFLIWFFVSVRSAKVHPIVHIHTLNARICTRAHAKCNYRIERATLYRKITDYLI